MTITLNKSTSGFIWKKKEYYDRFKDAIKQKFYLNEYVARIIASRPNIHNGHDQNKVASFLKPSMNEMPNPFHLIGMDKAIKRIIHAIHSNEKISVFSDYDVDGATSASLIVNYFKELKIDVAYHIPDRIKEGYGPNKEALMNFKDNNVSLCLILDCGTMAHAPLDYAAEIGLDVIVIDHHLSSENLPKAHALINPNRFDQNESRVRNCAAVGIVFMMLAALNSELNKSSFFDNNKREKVNLSKFLDIVALGTVCDVMELTGINRAFVKFGLERFCKTNNHGLKAMMNMLKIDQKMDVYNLGFMIGPRINAGGRIGVADIGATLLTTTDIEKAYECVQKLDSLNERRRKIEDEALKEAIITSQKNYKPGETAVIIVSGNWHPGVSGLIASRLKDIYNLPCCAISFFDSDSDIGKASCRSINNIDIGTSIMNAKLMGILIEGGGHKMAAGFSIEKSKLDGLEKFLNESFLRDLSNLGDSVSTKEYDCEIDLHQINLGFYEQLKILEPFGNGNPQPKFLINNIRVTDAASFSSGKHISCKLSQEGQYLPGYTKSMRAISFGTAVNNSGQILLSNPRGISILGSIIFKWYKGSEYLEFLIDDVSC